MKAFLLWVVGCVTVGVAGGYIYLHLPAQQQGHIDDVIKTGTPNPKATLVNKSFHNGGHTYQLKFYSDSLVEQGPLAKNANQDAVLVRPGHTATSYVGFAVPIDDKHASSRVDCGKDNAATVEFTVQLIGSPVSVCHNSTSGGHALYFLNVRANGTWHQITLFDNGLADLKPHDSDLKTILGSLKID